MNFKSLITVLALLIFAVACKSSKKTAATESTKKTKKAVAPPPIETDNARVAFYNVENLFDLADDPIKKDEDFTPEGKQKWTAERYQKKLGQIHKVVKGIEYPDFLGLCEVENAQVLEDLTDLKEMKKQNYDFEHFNSPDMRGIDVALLYNKSNFKVIKSYPIPVAIPDSVAADYTTRDILYVKGTYKKDHILHLFVNHWPSRYGGVEESEPKRVVTAQRLRRSVDSLFQMSNQSKIIIMGDFNDETDNKSVSETLKARIIIPAKEPTVLKNLAAETDQQGKGSYNYRGNWNMLDQIIISSGIAKADSTITIENQKIFDADWLMFKDKKYGPRPNRTYGGPNYYGGFSDHLAVFADLTFVK